MGIGNSQYQTKCDRTSPKASHSDVTFHENYLAPDQSCLFVLQSEDTAKSWLNQQRESNDHKANPNPTLTNWLIMCDDESREEQNRAAPHQPIGRTSSLAHATVLTLLHQVCYTATELIASVATNRALKSFMQGQQVRYDQSKPLQFEVGDI
jgi:hypothetical protein